jgi:arylsulfatase
VSAFIEGTEITSSGRLSRRKFLKRICGGIIASGLSYLPLSIGCRKPSRGENLNIILIILDTTRADRLGCYGYKRQTSPWLDRLANESVVYTRAIAPSSWTLPSHASLFTGKYTTSHGARYDPNGPLNLTNAIKDQSDWNKKFRARGLGKKEHMLAEILKKAGYATGAVVSSPWLKRIFGLDKGFDYYDDDQITNFFSKRASQVTSQALRWLKRTSRKKFFLFLNYFDPHYPYMPPGKFAHAFLPKGSLPPGIKNSPEEMNALYDAEILYMDYHIGKLLKKLKQLGLYDSSWIIVTADHGELLGEHGQIGHGNSLYQGELHIPLIIKYPGTEVTPRQEDVCLQLTDILPMILKRLQIPSPPNIQGNVPPTIKHPIFAEVYPLPSVSQDGTWRTIYNGNFKFLWNSKGNNLLFNLDEDPSESINLLEQYPDRAKSMELAINEFITSLPKPGPSGPPQEIDNDTKKALKSLGYVK